MELRTRIPEKLYFRIGEVCDLIKVQPHVLRYWESEFPMLTPQKNRAGQRVYRRKDVEMVFRIRDLLYGEKFTIAGAKKRLLDEQQTRISSRQKRSPREQSHEAPETLDLFSEGGESSPAAAKSTGRTQAGSRHESPRAAASAESSLKEDSVMPAIHMIRRELEDLLTMLDPDASIER